MMINQTSHLLQDKYTEYCRCLQRICNQPELIQRCYDLLLSTYTSNHKIFIAGNGGSAADSQHIAAELVGRFQKNRRPISAIALSTDTSCLTAIGNDFGYEDVFSRQIEAHVQEGDVLWLLSVSGQSPNIVKAINIAKNKKCNIILFTGKKCSSEVIEKSDLSIIVDSPLSDIVQGCHQFCYHCLCNLIESNL